MADRGLSEAMSPPEGANGLAKGRFLPNTNGFHLMGTCYVLCSLHMHYLIQSPQPPLDVNIIIPPFSG